MGNGVESNRSKIKSSGKMTILRGQCLLSRKATPAVLSSHHLASSRLLHKKIKRLSFLHSPEDLCFTFVKKRSSGPSIPRLVDSRTKSSLHSHKGALGSPHFPSILS